MTLKYIFRNPDPPPIEGFSQAFKLATNILAVYGRAYLLIFPNREKFLSEKEIVKSLIHWCLICLEGGWEAEIKNCLLTCFARVFDQTPPVSSSPHTIHVFRGRFGMIAYRDAFGSGSKNRIWANTILHGVKKGLPTVSDEVVKQSIEKHSELLSSDEPEGDSSTFLELVHDVSKEIFGGIQIEQPNVLQGLTQNSCLENTKSRQGAMGRIVRHCDAVNDTQSLVLMYYHPKLGARSVYTNKLEENGSELLDCRRINTTGESRWSVEIIREPLKVRTITKGELNKNAVWSDLQKKLWKALQQYPCFRLTHGDVPESFEGWEVNYQQAPSAGWVSGDYKNATDSIYTSVMEEAISGIEDIATFTLLRENLSRGIITYDTLCNRLGIPAPPICHQKRGQLMGSFFSFPVLCVVNVSCYLMTCLKNPQHLFDVYGYSPTIHQMIRDAPVLINGDDILFRACSDQFYKDWLDCISMAGFMPSIGKNYYSPKFSVVNSRLSVGGKVVPYVNMGIIYGKKKGDASDDVANSLRQKMWNLPGYFRDLWKDFGRAHDSLASRMSSFCMNSRWDLKFSGWCRTTLGLNLPWRWGGMGETEMLSHLKDQRLLRSSRDQGRRTLVDAERSLFWDYNGEVDPANLGKQGTVRYSKTQFGYRYVASMIKAEQRKKEREWLENFWASSVTPYLVSINITG